MLPVPVMFAGAVYADSWPRVESPPNAHVEWVGDNIVQNGVPMQIKSFRTESGVTDVIDFYKSQWASEVTPPVLNTLGEWSIIGHKVGDYYVTVQAKTGSGEAAEGFIGVSQLPGASKPGPRSDFPRMGGTDLVSSTDTTDGARSAKTIVMENSFSVESNVSFYESNLSSEGWTLLQSRRANPAETGADGHILYFNKRKQTCHIVVSPAKTGSTMVVANIVTNNI